MNIFIRQMAEGQTDRTDYIQRNKIHKYTQNTINTIADYKLT